MQIKSDFMSNGLKYLTVCLGVSSSLDAADTRLGMERLRRPRSGDGDDASESDISEIGL